MPLERPPRSNKQEFLIFGGIASFNNTKDRIYILEEDLNDFKKSKITPTNQALPFKDRLYFN